MIDECQESFTTEKAILIQYCLFIVASEDQQWFFAFCGHRSLLVKVKSLLSRRVYGCRVYVLRTYSTLEEWVVQYCE